MQVFLVDIANFLRTAFLIENLRRLFLTVLSQYSEVSQLGCFLFDFAPSRALELD